MHLLTWTWVGGEGVFSACGTSLTKDGQTVFENKPLQGWTRLHAALLTTFNTSALPLSPRAHYSRALGHLHGHCLQANKQVWGGPGTVR